MISSKQTFKYGLNSYEQVHGVILIKCSDSDHKQRNVKINPNHAVNYASELNICWPDYELQSFALCHNYRSGV